MTLGSVGPIHLDHAGLAEAGRAPPTSAKPGRMFTLAHLSDPHLGPLPRARVRDLASKRILGYINWHQTRAPSYRPEILVDLVEAVRAARPDHITVTGDLVNIALPEEMAIARAWLDSLGHPHGVSVIPGNHDAYVPGALDEARRLWQPFMAGDEGQERIVFPYVRRRGPIGIVGTSSARHSPPFMATGHLSDRQIGAIRTALETLGREGLFRVLLIHHSPVRKSGPVMHRLVGSERLRAVIREAGAELVLHGHNHIGSIVEIAGPGGPVPVVGVPSASNAPGGMLHPGAAFNIYRISGTPGRFACHMTEFGFTEKNGPMRLITEKQLLG